MTTSVQQIDKILEEVSDLPHDLHGCGVMGDEVLNAIVRHTKDMKINNSAETGSGKTTLLLSHISNHHVAFSIDFGDSIGVVRRSPLFNSATTLFVEGPTQKTVPIYKFENKLQFVLIDGPHGYPFPEIEYYFFYQHIDTGGLLVVDDVHIPTINNLFDFLMEEEMFDFVEMVGTTAFFRRNETPLFEPYADGWWLQGYNKNRAGLDILAEYTIQWKKNYKNKASLNNKIRNFDSEDKQYIKINRNNPYFKAVKSLFPTSLKKKIVKLLS